MRDQWATDFRERAANHWTDQRTRQLIGGKQLPITPREAPILLRALGLLNRDASLPATKVRKFRQINHMLLVVRPALRELAAAGETVRIVDAGCGRSYLSMLVAWWFIHKARCPVEVIGIDRNTEVIDECRRRTRAAGLEGCMRYIAEDLESIRSDQLGDVDALVALHACDTATDDALAMAVRCNARFIAVAPCCQAELAAAWSALRGTPGAFEPVWAIPHVRRTIAATVTDTFRVLLLRAAGYDTSATEFIEAAHTPKNTLIRAFLREPDPNAIAEYLALKDATGGVGIDLEHRLHGAALNPD